MIDIRSDTVTKPSDEMRDVISRAEVGDDVFGEDPNVNELQLSVAKLFGKESALYVPSGTMANQVSINAHTQPGNEVICEAGCHLYNYESGAPALLSGVMLRTIEGVMGSITAEQVEANIRPTNAHSAASTAVATTAFISLAPSRCILILCFFATCEISFICSIGNIVPPALLWVFSRAIRVV